MRTEYNLTEKKETTVDSYNELKKKNEEMKNEVESLEKTPKSLFGLGRPHLYYSKPLVDLYGIGVETSTRIAMSCIVNTVREIGWEKYLEGMEKIQLKSVLSRGEMLKEKIQLTGDSILDVKLFTLAWSNGCGFSAGAVYDFDYDHIEEFENWCPQVAALQYMGLDKEVEELGYWCDAYDALIMSPVNREADYTHAYCIGRGDKFCKQVVTFNEDGISIPRTCEENAEESLYKIIKRRKAEKRLKYNGQAPDFTVSYDKPKEQQDMSDEELGKHGSETKWHIATGAIILGGQLLGWERFINLISEKQSYGLARAAEDRRNEFNIIGNGLKEAATSVMMGYAGLPFEHTLTKYKDDEVVGIAHKCPIAETAKEMEIEKIEDLKLWCDFYKNFEVETVNPDYRITHTHCLACGDNHCRFTIK